MVRLSIVVFFLFSLTSSAMQYAGRVLVIGAGPAGLAAAERLMAKHYAVKVIEKNNRIGGKCLTKRCLRGEKKGGVVELGAIQVGIGYPKVNRYRKAIGMKLRDYWPSRSLRFVDGVEGPMYTDLSEEYWPLSDVKTIASEALTMRSALSRFERYNDKHFVTLSPANEFAQPFEQWADGLNLNHFKEDFRVWITSYGYGDLRDVPAYLPLSLINSSFGLIFMRRFDMNLRMLEGGYGGLLNGMVDHYGINVCLQSTIHDIERLDGEVRVTYAEAGAPLVTESFDHLVVACGMSCVGDLFRKEQRTEQEQALMDNLRVNPYDLVIAHVPGLEKGGYVVPQFLPTPGHVSLISKNSAEGDDAILYIPRAGVRDMNGRIKRPSKETLSATVKTDMAAFGFSDVEILRYQYWDTYFEHWNDPRFYHMLDSIQGQNHTFYVGAMARFEIVERAMQHAHDIVDKHILREEVEEKSFFEEIGSQVSAFYDYLSAEDRSRVE